MPRLSQPILSLPDNPCALLRRNLGIGAADPIRISYIPGPGDLKTTYDWWLKGKLDPRVPSIAYSTMFYELCDALGSIRAQVVTRAENPEPSFHDRDYHFETVPYRNRAGAINYFTSRLEYARACIRAVRRFHPHFVIVSSDFDWQYLPWLKSDERKLILSVHNTRWPMGHRVKSLRTRVSDAFYNNALRSVDAAVCTSHECERQIHQISHGFFWSFVEFPQQSSADEENEDLQESESGEPETFVSIPQQLTLPHEAPVEMPIERLIYLGRIEKDKGVFDLLIAFEALRRTKPTLQLEYAGDGASLEALRAEILKRELSDCVEALGRLDSKSAKKALRQADLLICPTRTEFNEGLAFVCFEAAGFGVPTVMSSVVPAQDLLEGGCVVYQANDIDGLESAIRHALDHKNYQTLRAETLRLASVTLDRTQSWGSQLYRAMMRASLS